MQNKLTLIFFQLFMNYKQCKIRKINPNIISRNTENECI